MNNLPWIALIAGMGALVALWRYLAALLQVLAGLVIVRCEVEEGALASAIRVYCFGHLRDARASRRSFAAVESVGRSTGRVRLVPFERLGAGTRLIWNRRRPVWIRVDPKDGRGTLNLYMLRWSGSVERVFVEALDHYESVRARGSGLRHRVVHVVGRATGNAANSTPPEASGAASNRLRGGFIQLQEGRLLRDRIEDLGPARIQGLSIDGLSLEPESRAAASEARVWRDNETWYRERGIPWRRGWLISGPPGCGKTSLARAVAQDLDLPVYSFDISSLTSEELRAAWATVAADTPCMALFEDIDAAFNGREATFARSGRVSFDTLLNCIDGVEIMTGLFVVITANDLARVDAALGGRGSKGDSLGRPGRIDRIIELGPARRAALASSCRRILPDAPEAWDSLISAGLRCNDTIARFQERVIRVALDQDWCGARPRPAREHPLDGATPQPEPAVEERAGETIRPRRRPLGTRSVAGAETPAQGRAKKEPPTRALGH